MRRVVRYAASVSLTAVLAALAPSLAIAQVRPTIEQFMGAASPLELVSARKADRVAWITYDKGLRNVYTAAAPSFTPVRLTRFLDDDGIDVTDVTISDDGSTIVFVRGSAPTRDGWVANPSHDPGGGERAIWAVRAAGGSAFKLAVGADPVLSPDGKTVLYVKQGQIFRAQIAASAAADSMSRGEKPFIKAWGTQSNPRWSPDGSKIAFVSSRVNHSFIAIYDVASRRVTYLSPGVDFDTSPTWSGDGTQIAFMRRPGLPFGQQGQPGSGSIGNPAGPAAGGGSPLCPNAGARGGRNAPPPDSARKGQKDVPGLCSAVFPGGHTLSVLVGNVASLAAHEIWHPNAGDSTFAAVQAVIWASDRILMPVRASNDEWERYWSLSAGATSQKAVMLTTTNGLIEDATSAALSSDRRTLYYSTNAGDIERRHIWAVPVAGGTPRRVTTGDGIETHPQPLANGKQVAVLYFDARTPASVAIVPDGGGKAKTVFPTLGRDFPTDAHVTPEIVVVKAPDGLEIHNQLFLPADIRPGEKRPALIFVHGGPPRQMMPGYHYMQFYHWAYGYNQWLASQGYVVLSVNYRSGIGYGRSFRDAPNTGGRGNAEYQDVLAAGKYLQTRADVDPARIGIWGLSYGGVLTAQALARNSDVFVAGADLAGVHLWGNALDTAAVSYRSSAIAAIDGWKSPVFLVHGDDDRNVDFAQTVGLVQLLRARNVHYELMVIPDDLHESMLHGIWIDTWTRIGGFLKKYVWEKQSAAASP
jgi:dipeptidyl aminopeptidase/acylaminoacyl peptidase